MSPFAPIRNVARVRRIALVGALAASLAATGLATASIASAVAPTFPDNLVVFPDRDFVMVENYQTHLGETATVEITRPGVGVVGSAQGVVAAGDVAFEVNHPGGVCWGAGTGLKVTPDILPGDVASISFAGIKDPGVTTVQDGFVTADAVLSTTTRTGDTVTVSGHIAAGVNQGQTEQRIIEPALTGTVVGRRDVRALPGPMTDSGDGYRSGMAFTGTTFTATYVFDDPAVATIVANAGGERLMSWEVVDTDGNRQGLTIAELGELGGPGVGGCPNGPLQTGPPGPTNVMATTVGAGVTLTWTPAVAVAGTPPITGYRATAVTQTTGPDGEQVEIGQRITGQAATGTTITGLSSTETYIIEVAAVSSVGQTFPPVIAIPVADTVPPTVSATPAGGTFATPQEVTLSANETGSQIFYTTDGTDPVQADVLAASAVHYTAPFRLSTDTTVKFVAFDPAGNVSLIGQQIFILTPPTVPGVPVIGTATAGNASATVRWTAPANAATSAISGYSVQAFAGTVLLKTQAVDGDVTSLVVAGLTNGTAVRFQVQALSPAGTGAFSALSAAVTPAAVPDAPVIGTLTAGNASATVTWTSPATNGGSAVLGYKVRVTNALTKAQVGALRPASAAATSLAVTGLVNGTPVAFQVQATNAAGTGLFSLLSNAVTPAGVPSPVTPAPTRMSDFNGDGRTDLVARDSVGRLWLYPGNGIGGFKTRLLMANGWQVFTAIVTPGDVTGDGFADIMARNTAGVLRLYSGNGRGGFLASRVIGATGWQRMSQMTAAGDLNGDKRPDLLARDQYGKLWLYPTSATGSLQVRRVLGAGWNTMTAIRGAGDLSGDGKADVLARDRTGVLWLYPGSGTGALRSRTVAGASGWQVMTALVTPGNWNGALRNDLLARDGAGTLWLYPGANAGTFGARVRIGTRFNGYIIA